MQHCQGHLQLPNPSRNGDLVQEQLPGTPRFPPRNGFKPFPSLTWGILSQILPDMERFIQILPEMGEILSQILPDLGHFIQILPEKWAVPFSGHEHRMHWDVQWWFLATRSDNLSQVSHNPWRIHRCHHWRNISPLSPVLKIQNLWSKLGGSKSSATLRILWPCFDLRKSLYK